MNALPVIGRELRVEARHAFNYWLRVLGVTVALGIFVVMMLDQQGSASQLGAKLFGNLNTALFIAIWVLVPLLTADCISRERRVGTLGLLLLTRLTSRGVVVGKCLIHGLRAATMLLAALPVLALPFLLGGVTWREDVTALLFDSGSVCLALAAGLIASSCCKQWNRALVLSEVLCQAPTRTRCPGAICSSRPSSVSLARGEDGVKGSPRCCPQRRFPPGC